MEALVRNSGRVTVKVPAEDRPLPPSSLHSFLAKDISMAGLLLTNHENEFANVFYNSEWDVLRGVDHDRLVSHLASVAGFVSAAVYNLTTGKPLPEDFSPNTTLVIFKKVFFSFH